MRSSLAIATQFARAFAAWAQRFASFVDCVWHSFPRPAATSSPVDGSGTVAIHPLEKPSWRCQPGSILNSLKRQLLNVDDIGVSPSLNQTVRGKGLETVKFHSRSRCRSLDIRLHSDAHELGFELVPRHVETNENWWSVYGGK